MAKSTQNCHFMTLFDLMSDMSDGVPRCSPRWPPRLVPPGVGWQAPPASTAASLRGTPAQTLLGGQSTVIFPYY